jgi:recombination protein RecA
MANESPYSDTLIQAIRACNKKFGEGSVFRLGDTAHSLNIELVPTGSLSLDRALGGGIPVGRTVEFFGPEMSGKTTLAQHVMREFQKQGRVAALIDAEHTFNKDLAAEYGLDVDNILISQPECGEQALDITESIVRSGDVGVVVIDSVSALTPRKELEGEMSDQDIALQARMMSKAMRKLTAALHQNNCTAIFINQLREKVGVMYGNPEVTSGGRALKFYATIRVRVAMGDRLSDKKNVYGHIMRFKVVKNKVAAPFREASVNLIYGKGFDTISEIADLSEELGLARRGGSWYYYTNDAGEELRWQGLDRFKQALHDDKELANELTRKFYVAIAAEANRSGDDNNDSVSD